MPGSNSICSRALVYFGGLNAVKTDKARSSELQISMLTSWLTSSRSAAEVFHIDSFIDSRIVLAGAFEI